MTKKLTFWRFLGLWFLFDLAMLFINGATVKSSLLAQFVGATLGLFLLFVPLYPSKWDYQREPKQSKFIIRIVAILQIILCFFIRLNF